jgi:hypothetical protein
VSKLRLMKAGHGDLCLAEWQADDPAATELAVKAFEEQRSRGCLAFRVDGPGRTERIGEFDAAAPEILLVPPVQGG